MTRRPPAPVRRAAAAPPGGPAPADRAVPAALAASAASAHADAAGPSGAQPARPAAAPTAPLQVPATARAGRAAPAAPRPPAAGAVRGRAPGARVVVAVVVLLVLGAAAWALLLSPLTAVRTVSVAGAVRTDPAAVRAAAAGQLGRPLLRVDAGAVTSAAQRLPWVASAEVARRWPHALVVRVRERVAVAAVPAAAGVDLLDADGRVITRAGAAPGGVPLVAVDVGRAGAGAVRAASAVARGLPPGLRAQVASVTASGPEDVRLALRDGRVVRWGSAESPTLKAGVAAALLARQGVRTVDVSAPTAPATAP